MTVIDTDPGIDDAIGILLAFASPNFTIAGITTVAGNIGIETTTRNASRLLAFAGREDIPVVRGAAAPLSRVGPEPLNLHGTDGIGGVALPHPVRLPDDRQAVKWLADFLMEQPAGIVDVLALGPLTNLARLVLEQPEAARRIGRIIAMGGAIHEHGNVGPRSEFNLWADPEAAAVVVASGLPLVLIPLDVTRRVRATREFVEALSASGKPMPAKVANLIESYFEGEANRESRPLHDPCVMLYALSPQLFRIEELRLSVDTGNGELAGALTISPEGTPVQVALGVDGPAALDLLARHLTTIEASASRRESSTS
ncbi:purine nucleosidase/pyrimidine-specific ribonucleoside hydrolase [Microvirga lupini]|uniref:Purine nucleosidase/pyrimidine-specific ribonucleoside hydrolase n=1 Tax=Microvirga lupini TaxID=420324 RepID=A0A7W4VMD0_9HYPH|nr:nucleoside hydrolase [Microvirga lupini]MBB3019307.1 purine nucleosidase/pyrimidine-specific ribonucleoside hydrolase [Microvirga lupini]